MSATTLQSGDTIKVICLPLKMYNEWEEMKVKFEFTSDIEFVAFIFGVLRDFGKTSEASRVDDVHQTEKYVTSRVGRPRGRPRRNKVISLPGEPEDSSDHQSQDTPVGSGDEIKVVTVTSSCSYCGVSKHKSEECDRTCVECAEIFRAPFLLKRHKQQVHEQYQCAQCRECVQGKDTFDEHMKEKHELLATRRRYKIVNYKELNEGKRDGDITGIKLEPVEEDDSDAQDGSLKETDKCLRKQEVDEDDINETFDDSGNCQFCESSSHVSSKCMLCVKCTPNKTFSSSCNFRRHWHVLHKLFACPTCDEVVFGRTAFVRHKREWHNLVKTEDTVDGGNAPSAQLMCPTCGERFRFLHYLALHEAKYHGRTADFHCDCCEFKGISEAALKSHMVRVHSAAGSKPSSCKICGDTFKSRKLLYNHRAKMHTGTCTCKLCGKAFGNKFEHDVHRRRIHLRKQDGYICAECGRSFASSGARNKHMYKVHQLGEMEPQGGVVRGGTTPTCADCGETFTNRKRMYNHRAKMHTGQCCCAICGEVCENKMKLYRHRRQVHAEKPAEGYKCADCGQSFSSQAGRKAHGDKHHRGVRFQCGYAGCGKMYTTKNSLLIHIATCHEQMQGSDTFLCNACGKGFRYKHQYSKHKYLHKNEADRCCRYCNKVCSSKLAVQIHEDVIHRQIRNFQCRMCRKGYGSLQHLNRHAKKYHGLF